MVSEFFSLCLCYGGHRTIAPLMMSLSYTNDITVVSANDLCRNKLESLQKLAQFEVVKADMGWDGLQVDSFIEVFDVFVATVTKNFRAQFEFLEVFF